MGNAFTNAFAKAWLISKEEVEEKELIRKSEERYNILLTKYWKMIELYKRFTYKNDKWEYDSKYFNEVPQIIINDYFLEKGDYWKNKSKITSTKLRQYYDMINSLYQSKLEWENLKTEFYMILAKANYDNGRKNIVPREFVDFLRINIDMIFDEKKWKEVENFRVFKKHFETVVAYAKWVLSDK